MVLVVVVMFAIVLPGLGEYEALHALELGWASSTARVLSLVGLLAASVVVLVPIVAILLRSLSFIPSVSYAIQAWDNKKAVRQIYAGWKADSFSGAADWMEPSIVLKLVEADGTEDPYIGAPNFGTFVTKAWQNNCPEWRGAILLASRRVMVYDRITHEGGSDQDGATLFTVADHKVKEMVVYQDRKRAQTDHEVKREVKAELPKGAD